MLTKYFVAAIAILTAVIYFGGQYAWGIISEQQVALAGLQSDLQQVAVANQTLTTAVQNANNERQFISDNMREVNTRFNQFAEQSREIDKVLSKHDLTYLASQKPGLIENRVNKGTKRVFSDLEDLAL